MADHYPIIAHVPAARNSYRDVMRSSAEQIEAIEEKFAARFAHWSIRLPPGSAARRDSGHIFEQGWHVGYVWGREGR